jgi:predicted amino acid dehydrogenase
MTAPLRIACLTLLDAQDEQERTCVLPQGAITWRVIRSEPDLAYLKGRIRGLLTEYDAVALEGLSATFQIAGRAYRHDYIWNQLDLGGVQGLVTDGSGLRASLERHLVRQAAEQLKPFITGKRILFFSGLNRHGSAEVLSGYSKHLVFGDLLYGFRLGIPINSFAAFVSSAPQLVRAVGQTPAQWYWPSARRSPRLMPRFQYYFRTADVIVGDLPYFQRYAPAQLEQKIVFTTLQSVADAELFAQRGVRSVISLTPQIDGQLMPLPVLEAALKLDRRTGLAAEMQDRLLEQIQELQLKPLILQLHAEEESAFALAQLPKAPMPQMAPRAVADLNLARDEAVAKFAFVIHPLSFSLLKRLPAIRTLAHFIPERLIEDAVAQVAPFAVGTLRNLVSATGARAEGVIYAVPMTSKVIMRFPPEFMYRKLEQVAELAGKAGCRLMGLGAYTSVIGDAGLTLSQRVGIGVTTGNSYTVAATMKTLGLAAQRCGIPLSQCAGLVIGATGSIGSICARLLAAQVKDLYLVSPRPERLLSLSSIIVREHPELQGHVHLSRLAADFLPLADVVITTTSAVDPVVDVAQLKPGSVVCDVARPPDIKPEAAASRHDILVIESGEIHLPEGAEVTYDIGLPAGTIYACLAETALLALDQRFGHFTLGREIEPDKVRLIDSIGEKHGFELAAIRSFGQVVAPEHFARLAQINGSRWGFDPTK